MASTCAANESSDSANVENLQTMIDLWPQFAEALAHDRRPNWQPNVPS
jgi:hypothetical protein